MEGEGRERNGSPEAEVVITYPAVVLLPTSDGLTIFFCLDFSTAPLCILLDASQQKGGVLFDIKIV